MGNDTSERRAGLFVQQSVLVSSSTASWAIFICFWFFFTTEMKATYQIPGHKLVFGSFLPKREICLKRLICFYHFPPTSVYPTCHFASEIAKSQRKHFSLANCGYLQKQSQSYLVAGASTLLISARYRLECCISSSILCSLQF